MLGLRIFWRRLGRGAHAEATQFPQHPTLIRIQVTEKGGVVQLRGTFGFMQAAQRTQLAQQHLTATHRKLLPFGQEFLANVALLFGRHLRPDVLALADGLPLFGGQAVPMLEPPANLRLALRREVPEALVVAEKALLLLRRHIP